MDWEFGVVVVSFFQLLPFNDGEAYELYRIFEDLVLQICPAINGIILEQV